MLETLWRTARGKRVCGALLESGAPRAAHMPLDALGLKSAGVGVDIRAGSGIHGIALPNAITDLVEVSGWAKHDVLDQLGANSCVANAMARAEVSTLVSRYGLDPASVPLGSRLSLYYWARAAVGLQTVDGGCFPSVALQQMAKMGLPPESSWPYSMARVNRRPGIASMWDGSQRRGVRGTYMIPDEATDRLKQARSAHASGRSVTMTIPVYSGFHDGISVFRWAARGDTLRGYHHVELVGTFVSESQSWGLCVNSWGESAHTFGAFVLDEPYLLEQASSFCVLDPEEPCQ